MPSTPTDPAGDTSATPPDRPPAVDAIFLGGGILLILVLALSLQAGPEPTLARNRRAAGAISVELAPNPAAYTVELLESAPAPDETPRDETLETLAQRARTDTGRLRATADPWILQIAAVCDPANAEKALVAAGADHRLHLLPALIGDDPCFRICWGPYRTAEDAARADDLSPSVRVLGQPQARRVTELLP